MFVIEGEEVIVLGDKTTHGGKVITASGNFFYKGKRVARVGDKVTCPRCKGAHKIVQGARTSSEQFHQVARHGDQVTCGASLLSGSNWSAMTQLAEGETPAELPCAYVTEKGPNTFAPPEAYDRIRTNVVAPLSEPVKGRADFGSGEAEGALQYTTKVNGKDTNIVVPDTAQGRRWAQDIHHSLGALTPSMSEKIDNIIMTPYPHPDDTLKVENGRRVGKTTLGETSYGLDKGRPYADLTFYPNAHELGLDYTVLHEASHPKIGLDSETLADDWKQIAADEAGPSTYAATDYFEDFCESNALYQTVKGGECEEEFAKAYPKRYERLNRLYQEEGK